MTGPARILTYGHTRTASMKARYISRRATKPILTLLTAVFLFFWVDEALISSSRSQRSILTRDRFQDDASNEVGLAVGPKRAAVAKNSTTIPSFQRGGVIVWLHIPKTGGTTIRKHFQRKHVTYLFSNRRTKYDIQVKKVDEWVANGPNGIGILEVHARNNPTLIEICGQLHQWRVTAEQNQVPFFAFTIVREPTSFSLSYFNYYHLLRWERRRFEYLAIKDEITEENFLRTMHSNPQCLFLTRSEQAYQRNFPDKRLNLTQKECDRAYNCLKNNMDWIGTTERLHNETMPLLNHIIFANSSNSTAQGRGAPVSHENAGPRIFGLANISKGSLQYIKSMTQWDEVIYQNVKKDYSFRDFGLSFSSE